MNIKVFDLKMPIKGNNSFDMDIISFKKNDFSYDHEKDNLINPFKYIPKSKSKKPLAYKFHNRSGLWVDKTPGVIKLNAILDKIINLGIAALSKDELDFLNNNS